MALSRMAGALAHGLIASSVLVPASATAQEAGSTVTSASPDNEIAALRAQVAALEAQLANLSARLDGLQASQAEGAASPAPAAAPAAPSSAAATPQTSFAGAPQVRQAGGWSFKPFGRLNIDAGLTDLPDALGRGDGFSSEMRRMRLGVEGDIPGGFGYKAEVDFTGGAAELTDAYVTYRNGGLTLTAGQHNNFQGMEELTSSRWSTFIERAAFTDAFGFERRLGLSAQYSDGPVMLQGGVFTDNVDDLPAKNWSVDARAVYAPKRGETQLHFGASLHMADLEPGSTVRYRQRPLVHFTSERPLATPTIAAGREFGAGVEAAMLSGRWHANAEAFWQNVTVPGLAPDPTFFGGFVEVGYYLTNGDSRGYRSGKWERTRPARGVDAGGPGAWQINLRYDYLDLVDAGIAGGQQDGYFASLIWVPTTYTRLTVNYGHLEYAAAAFALPGGSRKWNADVLGVRGQVDF
ncbi:porin [Alteraurantiacibacter palmitatis]|uniref:Porin n=1 Tax=Alteraurantiacibacter palmitatis TaxID=2054628 RepID=A0ABV7E6S6_9SPHN